MNRPSIVEVARSRDMELRKVGREYKTHCCFHDDTTPSLSFSEEKGLFHCFGCGISGDVFDFVMKLDGVSFVEAARSLGVSGHVSTPRRTVSQTAVDMATWANVQTGRAYSILREIDQDLLLADELGLKEESTVWHRECAILELLAEDLQNAKFIIELYESRGAIEQLLSDADIYWTPPEFPALTEAYREKLRQLVRGEA
jgi:hypothetical protein